MDKLTLKLKHSVPEVYKYLQKNEVSIIGIFSHVFLSAFIYKSPLEFAIRIFDLFLLYKEEALISCLVKIIGLMKEEILSQNSMVIYILNTRIFISI